jgi:uncharacterized membrane protein
MQSLLVLSHVLAISIYLGATVFLAILIEIAARGATDASSRRERWAALFRVYNPLTIGALGVVVMTGAWSLTPYKQALGAGYFAEIGSRLAGKLALAFVLIIVATWISFGICHRLVRAHDGSIPVTDAELDALRSRLRVALWLAVAITVATVWVAMGLRPPALT